MARVTGGSTMMILCVVAMAAVAPAAHAYHPLNLLGFQVGRVSFQVTIPEGYTFVAARTTLEVAYATSHWTWDFIPSRGHVERSKEQAHAYAEGIQDGERVELSFPRVRLPLRRTERDGEAQLRRAEYYLELTVRDPDGVLKTASMPKIQGRAQHRNSVPPSETLRRVRSLNFSSKVKEAFDGLFFTFEGEHSCRIEDTRAERTYWGAMSTTDHVCPDHAKKSSTFHRLHDV